MSRETKKMRLKIADARLRILFRMPILTALGGRKYWDGSFYQTAVLPDF